MNQENTAVIPLESDPTVFTQFAKSLGLAPGFKFIDIYSIDDENLIAFLERPIIAIILLFPVQKNVSAEVTTKQSSNLPIRDTSKPIWLKQTFKNACGLYALLHTLTNNPNLLTSDSILLKYCQQNNNDMNGKLSQFIIDFTNENKQQFEQGSGSSENPDPEAVIDLHFITFVSKDQKLWELDGRAKNESPFYLGEVQNIDKDSQYVDLIEQPSIRERILSYMNNVENENDKLNFSLIGFAQSFD
ncbi:similar to Saccharomyces cerevisiae YJR099W YUH1 Ubiquitin C-terminal hydrolase that cleaves ubiquitin-protein fusions to generate monomeric ubiquitin [Maudiozyma saulgeensis]|uniref:Ubiquitin carboxyl-terminal hydrolase n=1 Tax=Maudiozyma saulgeensis TaxID=1789683 RepID=A0A1X7R718_9SACH|nr:similar to Saccharomyces cerevisiae YJR099W YUH1 Ubiquitin C-terminal hydrolase that cleaves ubiquitin-protein fusions to generate monomeric ubiquitin [Kazachstania saulgeensis]